MATIAHLSLKTIYHHYLGVKEAQKISGFFSSAKSFFEVSSFFIKMDAAISNLVSETFDDDRRMAFDKCALLHLRAHQIAENAFKEYAIEKVQRQR